MTDRDPDAVPVRTADDWEETVVDGETRVTVTREVDPRNRLDRFLFDLFGATREREITLDPVGTTVWRHCDGAHTVPEVAAAVAANHDEDRVEPVDRTLEHFMMQLRERDLIRLESAHT
ncbi:MAG: hypothetical protein ACI9YT_002750 [Halobacteriales archaeon]|jgi:hypothetical protein